MAGKVDYLLGLKENVIMGRLIPAGSGQRCYRDLKVGMGEEDQLYIKEAMAADAEAEETASLINEGVPLVPAEVNEDLASVAEDAV